MSANAVALSSRRIRDASTKVKVVPARNATLRRLSSVFQRPAARTVIPAVIKSTSALRDALP